jgi:anti-sigma regulatory factor (Ser/Thr protein kinase)
MAMITAVTETSQIAVGRREAVDGARRAGFGEEARGRVAIVATELATNLVRHGDGGELAVERFDDSSGSGIELLALDKGRGMADVGRCLADGYSTAGGPGNGLGAVSRLADVFRIFSSPGLGTAVMARFRAPQSEGDAAGWTIGAVASTFPGEEVCGDAWSVQRSDSGARLFVADGSGHGAPAAAAARRAVEVFETHRDAPAEAVVEAVHRALAPTRGAAVALADVALAAGIVHFVGLGNIAGSLSAGGPFRKMASRNGTAGHVAPRIAGFSYPFEGPPTLILHTAGIASRGVWGAFPGLAAAHPSLIAGILYRYYRRERDDAVIVVLRAAA